MKEQLRSKILQELNEQREILVKAVKAATDATTHEDARQEGKYDTRAIESGYIAGAQAERLAELEANIKAVEQIKFKDFTPETPISSTALVEVRDSDQIEKYYFIQPFISGHQLKLTEIITVQLITSQSKLGQALDQLLVGDDYSYQIEEKVRSGEIVSVS